VTKVSNQTMNPQSAIRPPQSGRLQKISVIITIWALISISSSWAVDIHDDAGTTGAAFLKMEAGSRPVAMGGAFAGLANDVNTIFWNPAGLTTIRSRELTAMQNFSIAEISNQFIGYGQRMGKGVWGASFLGAFTEIERRVGPTDEPDSIVTVGGFAAGLSYAYELSPELSIGATAKGISQQLDVEDSIGAAADIGAILRLSDNRLGIGIAAQNIGFLDTEEDLPMALRGGVAYQVRTQRSFADQSPPRDLFAIVADVNVPIVGGYPTFHIGAENWFYNVIAVRVGYRASKGENPNNGVTAGIGIRRQGDASLAAVNFQFDYAFVPDEDLGNAHRIALITRF
jgi:hypothetical protein